ncbi:acyltransferase family protein [Mesorhizobium sp. A623]
MRGKHRDEIDGLRCIAVLSVLIYHAGFKAYGARLLPGGFLGVDVFFVISGYLISADVLSRIANESWSLIGFYERRARRILPALFVVVAVTIPFAWWLMTPAQMENFGASARATALFGSNIFFWLDTGYFSEAIELKPLAHTWSLAVEEQFYLVLPLVIWGLVKVSQGRYLAAVSIVAAAASFIIAQWWSVTRPAASFYLLPSRGWELLGGSLLALLETKRQRPADGTLPTVASGVGLALIIGSVILVDGSMQHPGLVTIPVIVGTMLLIWFAGAAGMVTQLLTLRHVVGIGLISYSLYLWHQPIFSFARLYSINDLLLWQRVVLIALSIPVAYLSWRYIERPFRQPGTISKATIWLSSAGATAAVLVWSGMTLEAQGWPERMPPEFRHLAFVERGYWNDKGEECLKKNCRVGDPAEPSIAIVGDSHAAMLAKSFDRFLKGTGKAAEIIADGDVYVSQYPDFYGNLDSVLARQKEAIFSANVKTVVLSSRAVLRVTNIMFDNGEGGVEPSTPVFNGRTPDQRAEFARRIREGVLELLEAGKRVVLVYPVPEVGWDVPVTLAKIYARGGAMITTSQQRYRERAGGIIALYDSIPDSSSLVRIYPEKLFCSVDLPGRCSVADAKSIFYLDDDHLSVAGSNLIVAAIQEKALDAWGGL